MAKKKTFIWDIVFIAAFLGVLAMLLWKCTYGFGSLDEAFYLTIPYRLVQGDALFVDEWHVSQLSGLLIYPFVKIYMMIVGHTEGIIIAFRYIYTAVQAAASLFIYIRLRKMSRPGALAASLAFFIYAPFSVPALSYNSLGAINLVIAGVIIATAKRAVKIQHIAAGLFFAAAVLCCPYLLIVYAVYTAAMIILSIFKKAKDVYSFKTWLFISMGAALLALIFVIFVLSRASVKDVAIALPNVLSDPEHVKRGLFVIVKTYVKDILFSNRFSVYIYAALAVEFIVMLIDKKRKSHRAVYFIIAAAFTGALLISSMGYNKYINYVLFPVNVLSVFCAVLTDNAFSRKLFRSLWALGMMYTFCLHMSSNQEYRAISSAAVSALAGSVMIAVLTATEIKKDNNIKIVRIFAVTAAACLICVQLGLETYMRCSYIFSYGGVLTESFELSAYRIEEGPSKGVLTSKTNYDMYMDFMNGTRNLKKDFPNARSIFFRSDLTYAYLVFNNYEMGVYSAWLSGNLWVESAMDRVVHYYELNPEKIPDLIYLPEGFDNGKEKLEKAAHYEEHIMENGAIVLERIY